MSEVASAPALIRDQGIDSQDFRRAVLAGLSRPQKELPCRFFYDEAGSELFEEITRLEEYYPARTETDILNACAAEIAAETKPGTVLIEFGSGSSTKTEILLNALPGLAGYVAIDVSETALEDAGERITAHFPQLHVETLVGDFAGPVQLPRICDGAPLLGFFPGSTIGNLTRIEAVTLMRHFAALMGHGARFIIGVDLKKDLNILLPAYNDGKGITAQFNLNLLTRINRELDGDFDLRGFRHQSIWNENAGRIEMHLISVRAQQAGVCGRQFHFAEGETIHTENSHKYGIEEFQALARNSGWPPQDVWTDAGTLFSVHGLIAV